MAAAVPSPYAQDPLYHYLTHEKTHNLSKATFYSEAERNNITRIFNGAPVPASLNNQLEMLLNRYLSLEKCVDVERLQAGLWVHSPRLMHIEFKPFFQGADRCIIGFIQALHQWMLKKDGQDLQDPIQGLLKEAASTKNVGPAWKALFEPVLKQRTLHQCHGAIFLYATELFIALSQVRLSMLASTGQPRHLFLLRILTLRMTGLIATFNEADDAGKFILLSHKKLPGFLATTLDRYFLADPESSMLRLQKVCHVDDTALPPPPSCCYVLSRLFYSPHPLSVLQEAQAPIAEHPRTPPKISSPSTQPSIVVNPMPSTSRVSTAPTQKESPYLQAFLDSLHDPRLIAVAKASINNRGIVRAGAHTPRRPGGSMIASPLPKPKGMYGRQSSAPTVVSFASLSTLHSAPGGTGLQSPAQARG